MKNLDEVFGKKDISTIIFSIVFIPLFILLIVIMWQSLKWRLTIDSTLLMYVSMLIDKFHYLPYKDMIDPNMLGTYFLYFLAGHFSNYSDFGFRIADLIYLILIVITTFLFLKRINVKSAWATVIIFGLIYLDEGPPLSFQREYLMILPLILALLITETHVTNKSNIKFLLAGVLLGCVVLIKPHGGLFLPGFIILRCLFKYKEENINNIRIVVYTLLGFMVPVLIAIGYILVKGIWKDLLEIALNYWPQYSEISGTHTMITGQEKYKYILQNFLKFGELNKEFLPGILGVLVAFKYSDISSEQKKTVKVIIGMAGLALIYPVFSAKMWFYHYFIFYFFLIMLGSLGLTKLKIHNKTKQQLLAIGFLAIFLLCVFPPVWELYEKRNPFIGDRDPFYWKKADRIAGVLNKEMMQGDYVQPLDWCAGVHQALLAVKAPLATKIMYNVDLYHHISSPYTQKLKVEFLRDLEAKKTRFIVRSLNQTPWITGKDTTYDFPELEKYIKKNYVINTEDTDFIIYERINNI